MSRIGNGARLLFLTKRRFSPLERRLLAAVRAVLPEQAQAVFDAQVAGINRSHRYLGWTYIDYYRLNLIGRIDRRRMPRFPCTDEMRLAEVRFRVQGRGYKAVLACVNGYIFEFRVSPRPKWVAFADWEGEPAVKLLDDPLRPSMGHKQPEHLPEAWVRFLAAHPTGLPGWTFYDQVTANRVTLDEGEFLVLAEREGDCFVLALLDPPATELFLLEGHDGRPAPLGKDIASTMTAMEG